MTTTGWGIASAVLGAVVTACSGSSNSPSNETADGGGDGATSVTDGGGADRGAATMDGASEDGSAASTDAGAGLRDVIGSDGIGQVSCSACGKVAACCTAAAAQYGADAASCPVYSIEDCTTSMSPASYASVCAAQLAAGQSLGIHACM